MQAQRGLASRVAGLGGVLDMVVGSARTRLARRLMVCLMELAKHVPGIEVLGTLMAASALTDVACGSLSPIGTALVLSLIAFLYDTLCGCAESSTWLPC
jgi:hypothetical protein